MSIGLASPLYLAGYLHGGSDPLGLANCFLVCPNKLSTPDACQSGACNHALILTSMKFSHDTHLDHQHSNCFPNPTARGGKHKPYSFNHNGRKTCGLEILKNNFGRILFIAFPEQTLRTGKDTLHLRGQKENPFPGVQRKWEGDQCLLAQGRRLFISAGDWSVVKLQALSRACRARHPRAKTCKILPSSLADCPNSLF